MSDTLFTDDPPASVPAVQHASPTPWDILKSAVEHNLDASQLEKLMDLQERWERNQAEREYNTAMHACQGEMPKVVKNARNTQTNSDYANLEGVQSVARPVYAKHGFSLTFGEDDCPLTNFKRTICDVRHVAGHCVRYHLDLPIDGVGARGNPIGAMNPVQSNISTTSYGQRRLMCMVFNVTIAGEDDDGQCTATVDQEQIATLDEWIESSGADRARFLKRFAIERLADLPAQQFLVALAELKRKAAQKK